MDELFKKALDYLLRWVVTLLLGGSGYQVLQGGFGAFILESYLRENQFTLFGQPALDDLYRLWGIRSFLDPWLGISVAGTTVVDGISPVDLLLSLLLLIGLIAHILFKPSLGGALQKLSSYRWPIRFYLRCYHALTLAFLSLLLCLFVLWSVKSGLIILLILIVVPSIAYLFMNSRDLTKGTFMERFVCVCLLLFLAVGLIGWPHLYGKRVFEPKFFEVTFAGDRPNRCDQSRYKTGPVLLAYQKNGKEMFCQICLGDDTKYIHFFEHPGAKPLGGGEVTLSSVATHFVPPVQRGEGEEAIADIREQLRAAGVVDP